MDVFLTIAVICTILIGFGLAYLVYLLYYNIYVGLILVLLLFVWETLAVALPGIILKLIVYPQDFVFLLIGMAAALRYAISPKYTHAQKIWMVFGVISFGSLAIGLVRFGTAAGVEFREYYYVWSGVAYVLSFPFETRRFESVKNGWICASGICVATACYRWTVDALGLSVGMGWAAVGAGTSFRVLNAAQTFVIAQGLIILVHAYVVGTLKNGKAILVPIFAISVMVLQHRTVWFSLIGTIATWLFVDTGARRKVMGGVGILIIPLAMAILTLTLWGGVGGEITTSVANSAANVTASQSTLTWRINSWEELLKDWVSSGPITILFGKPFGSGFARFLEGVVGEVDVAPHSYYVVLLLRVGLSGTFALLYCYWLVISRLFRSVPDNALKAKDNLLPLLLISQLIYLIAYGLSFAQSILVGMALANVGKKSLNSTTISRAVPSSSR